MVKKTKVIRVSSYYADKVIPHALDLLDPGEKVTIEYEAEPDGYIITFDKEQTFDDFTFPEVLNLIRF